MPALQTGYWAMAKDQFCAALMALAIDPAHGQGGAELIPGTGVDQQTTCE